MIIESFHEHDRVECKCGEISISGGNTKYITAARDYANFLRVDENDNEIRVTVQDSPKEMPVLQPEQISAPVRQPSRAEFINELQTMFNEIERLPQNAQFAPVTQYDHYRLIGLLLVILRLDG